LGAQVTTLFDQQNTWTSFEQAAPSVIVALRIMGKAALLKFKWVDGHAG
jgi:hypothetical protein